ncbi:cysteine/O-acetylserine transporter [Klebsiella pneumoniae]|uniref:Cysteine/O-acetylserine transporter n=1 Tax=Klebsiella pneumoniae TaxID=573 RepID=A0A939NPH9_KLEPN|nr:cysteine/O-acetylserine transporter [Klebsiella pneumoniae]
MTPLISAFLTHFDHRPDTRAQQYPALSSVTSHGLRRSLRVLAGMSVGFIITMLICAALTFSLVELDSRLPGIGMDWRGVHPVAGSADCQSKPATGTPSVEPVGFWASLGLQFVNVKLFCMASPRFLPCSARYREPVWLISVSLLLAAIGALGNLCWALAGHLFQRLFLLYGRQLNWMLAALLVYCAVRIVVE